MSVQPFSLFRFDFLQPDFSLALLTSESSSFRVPASSSSIDTSNFYSLMNPKISFFDFQSIVFGEEVGQENVFSKDSQKVDLAKDFRISAPASHKFSTHLSIGLYKTEMCRKAIRGVCCEYGIKCRFAHHENELRHRVRNAKYKTSPCKNFIQSGSCSYGERCDFAHAKVNSALEKSKGESKESGGEPE